jgi:hypothetical protein
MDNILFDTLISISWKLIGTFAIPLFIRVNLSSHDCTPQKVHNESDILNIVLNSPTNDLKSLQTGSFHFIHNILQDLYPLGKKTPTREELRQLVTQFASNWIKIAVKHGRGDCITNTIYTVKYFEEHYRLSLHILKGYFFQHDETKTVDPYKATFHMCACYKIFTNNNFEGLLVIDPSRFERVVFISLNIPKGLGQEEYYELISENTMFSYVLDKNKLKSFGKFQIVDSSYIESDLEFLRKESLSFTELTSIVDRKTQVFDQGKQKWLKKKKNMQENDVLCDQMNKMDQMEDFIHYINNGIVKDIIVMLQEAKDIKNK